MITRRASIATILIIDDEEPVRALLQTTLEAAGHAVVEAPNAMDALLKIVQYEPAH
ncbi:MAG TPA: hypothetical protein VLA67_09025 [Nitrospiraceae bacterium]|nr:hypothetical protein [Nitrospiraceae bacterium]